MRERTWISDRINKIYEMCGAVLHGPEPDLACLMHNTCHTALICCHCRVHLVCMYSESCRDYLQNQNGHMNHMSDGRPDLAFPCLKYMTYYIDEQCWYCRVHSAQSSLESLIHLPGALCKLSTLVLSMHVQPQPSSCKCSPQLVQLNNGDCAAEQLEYYHYLVPSGRSSTVYFGGNYVDYHALSEKEKNKVIILDFNVPIQIHFIS